MTLGELMLMGWTWQGPLEVQEPGEEPHFEIRVRELPEFFVAGRTREQVLAGVGPALKAFLQSYLDAGETPPLPVNQQASWVVGVPSFSRPRAARLAPEGAIIVS